MRITTAGKELLQSTTFIALGLGETVIVLDEGPESLRFILNFIEGEGTKESIAWEPTDNNTLKINLTNWNNALGTTLTEAVEVGSYLKRRLFLLFYISKAGKKGELREVTFSLYLGDKVLDG